jgi:hypothetical protein
MGMNYLFAFAVAFLAASVPDPARGNFVWPISLCSGLVGVLVFFLSKRVPKLKDIRYNELSGFFFYLFSLFYGTLIAYLAGFVWLGIGLLGADFSSPAEAIQGILGILFVMGMGVYEGYRNLAIPLLSPLWLFTVSLNWRKND